MSKALSICVLVILTLSSGACTSTTTTYGVRLPAVQSTAPTSYPWHRIPLIVIDKNGDGALGTSKGQKVRKGDALALLRKLRRHSESIVIVADESVDVSQFQWLLEQARVAGYSRVGFGALGKTGRGQSVKAFTAYIGKESADGSLLKVVCSRGGLLQSDKGQTRLNGNTDRVDMSLVVGNSKGVNLEVRQSVTYEEFISAMDGLTSAGVRFIKLGDST